MIKNFKKILFCLIVTSLSAAHSFSTAENDIFSFVRHPQIHASDNIDPLKKIPLIIFLSGLESKKLMDVAFEVSLLIHHKILSEHPNFIITTIHNLIQQGKLSPNILNYISNKLWSYLYNLTSGNHSYPKIEQIIDEILSFLYLSKPEIKNPISMEFISSFSAKELRTIANLLEKIISKMEPSNQNLAQSLFV